MTTMINKPRVHMVRLGCDKNDVDADIMSGLLLEGGYELTADPEDAAYILVNTCGFINPAKEESISYILEALELKEERPDLKVIVTGCLAERYAAELREELSGVDAFVGIGSVDSIVDVLENAGQTTRIWRSDGNLSVNFRKRYVSPGQRTAYVKIAEGCDSFCSYCAIPLIRGRFHSRRPQEIIDEVGDLAARGVLEIILVAQNTTAYGTDLAEGITLTDLLRRLLEIDGVRWFRLLYCYPGYITDELLELMAAEERLASYLDIPVQHADRTMLQLMNREAIDKIRPEWFTELRRKVPGLTLRTTVLVGFPGESEQAFRRLLEFINEVEFDHLGAFAFSPEEGTAAVNLPDPVDEDVARERVRLINEEQQLIAHRRRRRLVGRTVDVLIEEPYGDGLWKGRGQTDAPEIDGFVLVSGPVEAGELVRVRIESSDLYISQGRTVTDETHS